jgi:hypothetical protein
VVFAEDVISGQNFKLRHYCRSLGQPPHIEHPHEPVGIAPLGLALDEECFTVQRKLIAGTRARDLARPHLKVAVSAWMRVSPNPTIVSGRWAITRTRIGSTGRV